MQWVGREIMMVGDRSSPCTAGRTSGSSTASTTRSSKYSTTRGRRDFLDVFLIMVIPEYHPAPNTAKGMMRLCAFTLVFNYSKLIFIHNDYILVSRSILTSCIGKSGSEDDLSSGNNGNIKRPVSPNPGKPGNTWTGHRQGYKDEDDGFDDNYFRRRPKSFYFEGRRMCGEAGSGLRMSHVNIADENYFRSMTMVIYYDQTRSLITLILLHIGRAIQYHSDHLYRAHPPVPPTATVCTAPP